MVFPAFGLELEKMKPYEFSGRGGIGCLAGCPDYFDFRFTKKGKLFTITYKDPSFIEKLKHLFDKGHHYWEIDISYE